MVIAPLHLILDNGASTAAVDTNQYTMQRNFVACLAKLAL